MTKLQWSASVVAEGGPLIIAGLSDFSAWRGTNNPATSPPTTLHFWGQFTSKLPKKFQPDGPTGHQYLSAKTNDEARAWVGELDAFIQKKWRGAATSLKERKGSIEGGWVLPDGRSLRLELVNPSPYDLACNALSDDGFALFAWEGRTTAFWDIEGGGVAFVGTRGQEELLLVRQWIDEDEDELTVKTTAEAGKGERKRGTVALTDSAVVVAWAVCARAAIKRAKTDAALRAIAKKKDPTFDGTGGGSAGAVVTLRPGRYTVATGASEAESWSCRWCRLRRS